MTRDIKGCGVEVCNNSNKTIIPIEDVLYLTSIHYYSLRVLYFIFKIDLWNQRKNLAYQLTGK